LKLVVRHKLVDVLGGKVSNEVGEVEEDVLDSKQRQDCLLNHIFLSVAVVFGVEGLGTEINAGRSISCHLLELTVLYEIEKVNCIVVVG
jgi:hypothetical protein